ncbi:hypothetical protein BN1211_4191 [Cyberlindnera jadinii]|uniref:Uncharacterized protein n=1 Tax=Cyberlindnera jadinii (strain ATCC 18201 / CBS 1600 / BCRC 20928 / JCM 3617 / NBRC 0987 / NRRL Y-1542) TaxID=983966 RepID=A0A0H5C6Q5_CYBJN|nr:hypothetical protein BN1211_4191 [Cyberlindnera jadinii]
MDNISSATNHTISADGTGKEKFYAQKCYSQKSSTSLTLISDGSIFVISIRYVFVSYTTFVPATTALLYNVYNCVLGIKFRRLDDDSFFLCGLGSFESYNYCRSMSKLVHTINRCILDISGDQ